MNLFELSTKTYCGFGITKDILPKIVEGKRVCLILDGNLDHHKLNISSTVLGIPLNSEPSYDGLQKMADTMRKWKAECVVGLGGGSAMDYAKALAILYTNPGRAIDYRGFDKVVNPGLPTILIPTTAGTGSEVTPNAVFTDTNKKRKLGINGRHMRATYAILDAEWTLTCPYSVALSSLLDAFVHAVESYMAPEATPLTRALSREAFRLLYQNALCIRNKAWYADERQNLLYGAYLAAMALSNSGSGVVGAMSYPLGVHFGIPHGYAGGIFLPDIIHHNIECGYDFTDLIPQIPYTIGKLQRHMDYLIKDLWTRLEVPNLNQWIATDYEMGTAQDLVCVMESALQRNPVPLRWTEIREFIARHL